jgi:hypothetical protein
MGWMMTRNIMVLTGALIVAFSMVTIVLAPDAMSATQGVVGAEINYGTDRDVYNRGDTVNGFVEVRNTGDTTIDRADVKVSVSRNVPIIGAMRLASRDLTLTDLNIRPGGTKRMEFSEKIPAEFAGISTAGRYRVTASVTVDGKDIGTFTKDIEIK